MKKVETVSQSVNRVIIGYIMIVSAMFFAISIPLQGKESFAYSILAHIIVLMVGIVFANYIGSKAAYYEFGLATRKQSEADDQKTLRYIEQKLNMPREKQRNLQLSRNVSFTIDGYNFGYCVQMATNDDKTLDEFELQLRTARQDTINRLNERAQRVALEEPRVVTLWEHYVMPLPVIGRG